MKKRTRISLISIIIGVLLVLAACGGNSGSSDKTKEVKKDFPLAIKGDGKAKADGVANVALVSDTPFQGILNPAFTQGTPDQEIESFFYPSLFGLDKDYNIANNGAGKIKFSDNNKKVTVTLDDKLAWSDGKPVTADDYIFAFEVIGNKDYDGVRYDDTFSGIEGMDAYHAGKADKISGIKKVDDKTVELTYKAANPTLRAGLWSYPIQKAAFKGIPVAKMSASDPVRKNPVGYGPFKIKSMVTGESVKFVANEHYYAGKPKLAGVNLSVASPDTINESLKQGKYDLALSYPTAQYDPKKVPSNVTFLGDNDLSYSYLGFKLGHYDKEKQENVMDKNAKMADPKLRQAMAYAMNNAEVGKSLYKGLRTPANSLIIPNFTSFYDKDLKGYTYDPKKAKKLLADAGYTKKDKDGYLLTPDGKPLVIHLASMSGDKIAEPLAKFYIQNWKDIGIHVELTDGRLMEFNSFYDRIEKDDKDIDIYLGAWGTGTDVNPAGLYSRTSAFNYSRYVSKENDKLLAEGQSEKAFDTTYRADVYKKWQELMVKDAPVVPTLFRYSLNPVNKRLQGYSLDPEVYNTYQEMYVTDKAAK